MFDKLKQRGIKSKEKEPNPLCRFARNLKCWLSFITANEIFFWTINTRTRQQLRRFVRIARTWALRVGGGRGKPFTGWSWVRKGATNASYKTNGERTSSKRRKRRRRNGNRSFLFRTHTLGGQFPAKIRSPVYGCSLPFKPPIIFPGLQRFRFF